MGLPAEFIPNYTIFIQLGLFFVCYFMLNKFIFAPYLSLLEARRMKTSGLKEKAATERERAEKLKEQYETFMRAERKKVGTWVDEERKKISEQERLALTDARNQAAAELKKKREQISHETDKIRKDLAPLVNEYSSLIASKLAGRKVSVSGAGLGSKKSATAETTV